MTSTVRNIAIHIEKQRETRRKCARGVRRKRKDKHSCSLRFTDL